MSVSRCCKSCAGRFCQQNDSQRANVKLLCNPFGICIFNSFSTSTVTCTLSTSFSPALVNKTLKDVAKCSLQLGLSPPLSEFTGVSVNSKSQKWSSPNLPASMNMKSSLQFSLLTLIVKISYCSSPENAVLCHALLFLPLDVLSEGLI